MLDIVGDSAIRAPGIETFAGVRESGGGVLRVQRIVGKARRMRRLGMSLRAIGAVFGVDEKTVRKALVGAVS